MTRCLLCAFDLIFIECFTTTFLRAHSWLNWVDEDDNEDEVGLKEKPEDTRCLLCACLLMQTGKFLLGSRFHVTCVKK